ncbi:MAG: hypothetical protein H8E72_01350 [Candidatus Marinimicrobia bacterium]|nr:hypothetical protein [Candidatus Neomarinimicrobiota bacterium]
MKKIFFFCVCSLLMADTDHLVFSRITIKPDNAELISIKNPSSESVTLDNYYISDSPNYYKIQSENNLSPGHSISDFLVKFPEASTIGAGDSILISIQSNYVSYYGEDFEVDFTLSDLIETESGSAGLSSNGRLDDAQECLILFYWDGTESSPIKDVDYFLWGGTSQAVNKSSVSGYSSDTAIESQVYLPPHESYYTFSRQSLSEQESTNGNGISGHDETSENFTSTWESRVAPEFLFGCTDSDSPNYNSNANTDDGSCVSTFTSIINNCQSEVVECSGKYDLPANNDCPLYEQSVAIEGTVVDFYDITPNNGPYSFKLEDDNGYRISFVVWPTSSIYQDGFDILLTELAVLAQAPFDRYYIRIKGKLDVYCSNESTLNVFNDWQIAVEYETDITIIQNLSISGDFESDTSIENISITPAPFVIIPSLGETLDFSFTVLKETRAIVRIFDLSGRFITSLVDDYYEFAGKVSHEEGLAPWDGRDQLGQIVSPGTYIMHLEVFNPVTGETLTDTAPIVVGVKN